VLLLGGGKSPAFATTCLFRTLADLIPNTTTEILKGNGHMSPTGEHPDAVAAAVESFLLAA
jgi:pimeloyl-ACP methyl ester carboxylesterase